MIDGWEGHDGLCNPLAQGATAKSKDQAPTKQSDEPGYLPLAGLLIANLHMRGFAQWLGQSRTSFSHVLSQNETWWSPAWFPLEQQR